jgi:hypothetical protein
MNADQTIERNTNSEIKTCETQRQRGTGRDKLEDIQAPLCSFVSFVVMGLAISAIFDPRVSALICGSILSF